MQSLVYKALCTILLGSAIALFTPVTYHAPTGHMTVKEAEAKKKKTRRKKVRKPKKTIQELMQEQTTSSKWAAVVVDANEGRILYEKNAEKRRYPASLTKMMTLYMLFDAMKRKKVRIYSSMSASAKAASQPQTNISLKKGDRITVKQAIRALVVRSANDVALVVAEHLAGSESGFARRMNAKARELGMHNTKFYNPHGLPNSKQVSTAIDMAKLSIALKRDFPEYYHYFKTTSFRFNGKTYKSHNRVLGKYPGVDGLKTGYIRASGFNLATSLKRGNTRLVGVIMGGITGASRDQEMINMLDRTLIAMQQQQEQQRVLAAKEKEAAERQRRARLERQQTDDLSLPPIANDNTNYSAPQFAGRGWAVQVGAFPSRSQAVVAADAARSIAPTALLDTKLRITQVMKGPRVFNRARLMPLTADEARTACDMLADAQKQCMVVRME